MSQVSGCIEAGGAGSNVTNVKDAIALAADVTPDAKLVATVSIALPIVVAMVAIPLPMSSPTEAMKETTAHCWLAFPAPRSIDRTLGLSCSIARRVLFFAVLMRAAVHAAITATRRTTTCTRVMVAVESARGVR